MRSLPIPKEIEYKEGMQIFVKAANEPYTNMWISAKIMLIRGNNIFKLL